MNIIPSLERAQRLILASLFPLPAENVPLLDATGRIAAQPIKAIRAVPDFARSSMDGFAIDSKILANIGEASLRISGEIAAGTTNLPILNDNTAIRIMTGGAIPAGADQVIPVEQCRLVDDRVLLTGPSRPGGHIRPAGADLRRGETIVAGGQQIEPQHLPLLAESGCDPIQVVTRPKLAILCTGSELLDTMTTPLPGQIVGGNRFLLQALTSKAMALVHETSLANDDLDAISERLAAALAGPAHMVITTGGMGPGKFDLLPQAFARLGIKPLYQALAVRPGRSTMFGMAGTKPVFALPGPPPAVFLLFHELVLPALRQLQGQRPPVPTLCRAILSSPLSMRKTGILNLKTATARLTGATLTVCPAKPGEIANAIIRVPANRRLLRAGETVRVRLCGSLA